MFAHDPSTTSPEPAVQPAGGNSDNSPTPGSVPADMLHSKDWEQCARVVQMHGDQMVGQWKSEIDTLMVFAGLFSAILTAFNVESYKLLQEDQADEVVALLKGISVQLNGFTMSAPFINATIPHSSLSLNFTPPRYAVWMNALWFCALVCTLSASSIAITVRQWLLHYEVGLSGASRAMARLRQARYEGLLKWRVASFVATIPVLLQIALMLFLAGLLILLWSLHPVVATVASMVASFLVAFTAVSTVLPAFWPGCCYRSPQASWFFQAVQQTGRLLATCLEGIYTRVDPPPRPRPELARGAVRRIVGRCCNCLLAHIRIWSSWEDRDIQHTWMRSSALDFGLIRRVYEITWDEKLLNTVLTRCLNDIDLERGFRACVHALQQQERYSWGRFHSNYPVRSQAADMHPDEAMDYRSSRFHTYLFNQALSAIPKLARKDPGALRYGNTLQLLAPKILYLFPPYSMRPGLSSVGWLGSDKSFFSARSILHSLAVLVAVKAAPESAFMKLAHLVQIFGNSRVGSTERIIEQLGAQETDDIIAAFPQTKDDMTKLVMLDPKSCPEHLPGISIYMSAGAAAALLRELLGRRVVACDGDQPSWTTTCVSC
ncbi:hypothetical protein OH76DRAFT_1411091 [Lentinus brumalis]|uniref:DUF6535 domain-containing protein n=1 Tax=Lentinus brumalis TaxID=2498619 RepID=A0A371CQE9_9APHY|nr:hypothetical protein OH76DRAFT_1411091 [Polyporus brumalis]